MIPLKTFRLRERNNTIDTIYREKLTFSGIKYVKSQVEYFSDSGGKVKKGDFTSEEIEKEEFDSALKKYKNQ